MSIKHSPIISHLQEWLSTNMIPVVLQLLKEYYDNQTLEFHDNQTLKQNHAISLGYVIQTYEKIFQYWKGLEGLNKIQLDWLDLIGDYIQALQKKHTLFSSVEKKIPEDMVVESAMGNNQNYQKTPFSF